MAKKSTDAAARAAGGEIGVRTELPKKSDGSPDFGIETKFDAYTGEEPYLFVSYSHADCHDVYPILDKLHDLKYRIWYDESCENGNDFREELRSRIFMCEGVLLFVSANSMASPYCGMEVIVAREYNKRIFPIYVDDCEIPAPFRILFANTHHGVISDDEKLIKALVRDLPATAMDRLTTENGMLKKCEDNGKSIVVDEGITIICSGAFKERKALHNIKLPETLEKIEPESFRGCSNLEEIIIPRNTLRIGESAFRDCINMKRLGVANDSIKIGERAFENCSSLETVDLPGGMTEIYGGVFNSCKRLKNIKLPEDLTILGESAFSDCIGLEEIVLPEGVTKIDDLAFNGCSNMSSITLSPNLKKIGKSAFKNCTSLVKVDIPASVSSIDSGVFRGCQHLRSIEVDPKNKYYKSSSNKRDGGDYVLFNKNKSLLIAYPASSREVQYDVPDSVVTISDWSFSEAQKLNRIYIPDSVQSIGEGAFCNCILLDEIQIPDSVVRMDDCVFRGCENLERVIIPNSVTDIGWGLFDGCETKVEVFCNEDSEIYKYCKTNKIKTRPMAEASSVL